MRCYNCGGEVLVNEESGIGICLSCAAEIPVPKDTVAPARFEKANVCLSESRFDEAKEIFTELLIDNPLDAAVCWGLAVSEYGIEYVTDPATGAMVPTLHRLSNTSFSDYIYTKQAVKYAVSNEMKAFYETQSRQIDRIQTESLQISSRENPYDVFICYKRMETDEKRTADARIAADYYKELTQRGYKVFFAEVTLTAGEEYEPRIFAALQSARVMIAIASKLEYYQAVWVRNEWSRYAAMVEENPDERTLIPVYSHMSHDMLPEAPKVQPQYVEMDSLVNPRQTLLGYVAQQFEGTGSGDISAIRRQAKSEGYSRSTAEIGESAENYLVRATGFLVNGEFDKATEYFERANKLEELPDAHLGLMMCCLEIPGREALGQYDYPVSEEEEFLQALACADAAKKEELQAIAETCRRNAEWKQTCETQFEKCSEELDQLLNTIQNKAVKGIAGFADADYINGLCDRAIRLKNHAAIDFGETSLSRVWLIGLNLLPSLFCGVMWLLGGEYKVSETFTNIVIVYCLVQIVGNFILLNRALRKKNILCGGFLAGVIRLALCAACAGGVTALMFNYPYVVAPVALIGTIVLLRIQVRGGFLQARIRLHKIRKTLRSSSIDPATLPLELRSAADKAFHEIVDPMEQYHYDQEAWDEMIERMRASCLDSAEAFAESVCEKFKRAR